MSFFQEFRNLLRFYLQIVLGSADFSADDFRFGFVGFRYTSGFFLLFILLFAVIHYFGDGRLGCGRYFYQVKAFFFGYFKRSGKFKYP